MKLLTASLLGLCTAFVGCDRERSDPVNPTRTGGNTGQVVQTTDKGMRQQRAKPKIGAESQQTMAVEDPVAGVVYGPDGKSQFRARVRLFRRQREWPRRDRKLIGTVRSGKGGGFVFGTTRDRNLEIEVVARGCAVLNQLVPLSVTTLSLYLSRGFRVEGRVHLPDNAPAADCAVYLEPGFSSRIRAETVRTDAKGGFVFANVPAENLRLTARDGSHMPVSVSTLTVGRRRNYVLKFEESGLGLKGRIVSVDSGAPLAGSRILVYPLTQNGILYVPHADTTGKNGEFTVRGLAPGSYNVEVRHEDHSSVQRKLSVTRSRTELLFELPPRVKVEGKLVGATNIKQRRLTIVSFYGEVAATDVSSDGTFRFEGDGLSRGLATLELEEGDLCFKRSRSRWVLVSLTEDGGKLSLEVEPSSLLEGRVTTTDGKPLAGVKIVTLMNQIGELGLLAQRQRVLAVTNDKGVYSIRGLVPGDVNISLQKDSFACLELMTTVMAEAKAAKSDVPPPTNLSRPGRISGRVTRGKQPVMGARVYVGQGVTSLARTLTGRNGRYVLRGLPPGSHVVRVKFATLPIAHSAEAVEVKAGVEAKGVDIGLAAGRRIVGRIVDLEETPIPDVIVESPIGTATKTDDSGHFALSVPLGRTALHLRLGQLDPVMDSIIVRPGENEIRVRLDNAPRGEVKARVVRLPSEKPVDGVILRLDSLVLKSQQAILTTSQSLMSLWHTYRALQDLHKHHWHGQVERWIELTDGNLDQIGLPNGKFKLTIQAKGLRPFSKIVTLINGKVVDLGEVRLKEGAEVRGVVVDPMGVPVPGAEVVIGRESDLSLLGARVKYRADEKGAFTIAGVGLEHRQIYVCATGYATQSYTLNVPGDILRKDPIRVQMHQGATIKVVLIDRTGDAVPFKMIDLNRGFDRIASKETDAQGIAWFHNLSKGDYHAFVRGRLRTMRVKRVTETKGGKTHEIKIRGSRRKRSPRQRIR